LVHAVLSVGGNVQHLARLTRKDRARCLIVTV
jgi:hypothetical protein